MPANMTFEAAATLPTVFITADSAFKHATALQPGDRVLVHAAAGESSPAMVQLVHGVWCAVVSQSWSSCW